VNLAALIRARRTVGAFRDEAVDPELIADLLDTAVWTPNHRLTQPWRFVVLTGAGVERYAAVRREMVIAASKADDEAERQDMGDRVYAKFASIPAYLLVIQKEAAKADVREEDYAACAALIQNFLLLAWERGIGTAWKTFKNDARLRALFALADDEKVVGIIHIGYPADEHGERARVPARDRISHIG
jgi:nitroreductase